MKSGFIYVKNNIFPTLLALSEAEQSRGLMYEKWQPPIMSFIYPKPQVNKFWMHNTPSPLDIVFSYNGVINQIVKGEPFSTKILGEEIVSDLVVEFPAGTLAKLKIGLYDEIGLIK